MDPLVSIGVVTYNSSKYIVETLESVKNQTYQNIELIISDDCSSDDTVAIAQNWLNQNGSRFVSTKIITVENNTGVSGNVNRCYRACTGEWIKSLDGDDLLCPNCIEDFIEFTRNNQSATVVFSNMVIFTDDTNKCEPIEIDKLSQEFYRLTCHEQYDYILENDVMINAPTLFFSREVALKNPSNELYRFLEDFPKWVSLTKKQIKLHLCDSVTVKYRVGESISHGGSAKYFSDLFYDSFIPFYYIDLKDELKKRNCREMISKYEKKILIYYFAKYALKNKRSIIHSIIIRLFISIFNLK